MGLMDSIRNTVINWLWPNGAGQDERAQKYYSFSDYYTGAQRRQLRVKIGQADDNLTVNLVTLVIDRGISMLLGDGVTFDLPGDDPESPETPPGTPTKKTFCFTRHLSIQPFTVRAFLRPCPVYYPATIPTIPGSLPLTPGGSGWNTSRMIWTR